MSPLYGNDGVFGWLGPRGFGGPQGSFNNSGNRLFQSATNRTFTASQQMQLNEFRFAAAKSIRTSTIILATFNTIAAFATAVGILIDSYFRKRRNVRNFSLQRHGFSFVPEGEVYPLVLSFGIVVQSITFAVAQSTGLEKLFDGGCTLVSQMMLPAVFLVPYIQLVFGIEITMRAFQKDQPFGPRAKWGVSICLAIVGLLTLTNFLVANFQRASNLCLKSLFWFVAEYSTGCFIILVVIVASLLGCAIVIFVKLHKSIKVEVTARVNASRMVYYLALAAISSAFTIPFFYVLSFVEQSPGDGNALTLAMVAAVVANVSGLMTGGLYLFLKSSTLSTIGPSDKVGEYQRRRARYKNRRTSSSSDYDDHVLRSVRKQGGLRRTDSDSTLISYEKEEERGGRRPVSSFYADDAQDPLRSNAVYPVHTMPKPPRSARLSTMSSAINHMRKRSYAMFPGSAPSTKSSVTLLPSTTYSPNPNEAVSNTLRPPPSMQTLTNGRHRRDSSLVSTATVQIGLRFSSMDDIPPVAQSKVVVNDTKVHTLDCPKLRDQESDSPRPVALLSPAPAPAAEDTTVDGERKDPAKEAKMKTLPPVPKSGVPIVVDVDDIDVSSEDESDDEPQGETLKPQVYAPQSPTKTKLPSPKGVGFTMVSNKTSSTGSSSSSTKPATGTTKADWI